MRMERQSALRLFISHSPEEATLKDRLLEHFAVLQRTGRISISSAEQIPPGTEPRQEIHKLLKEVDAALLLLSSSFLASSWIQDVELSTLLARHQHAGIVLLPVIVRPCAWQEHPGLKELAPYPRSGTLTTAPTGEQDELLRQLTHQVMRLCAPGLSSPPILSPSAPAPSNLWGRRQEDELLGRGSLLTAVREVLVGASGRGVVLHGESGVGKTALAEVIASAALDTGEFPDGVVWITARSQDSVLTGLAEIGVVTGCSPNLADEEKVAAGRQALRRARRMLLVLDDLGEPRAPWVEQECRGLPSGVRVLATAMHSPAGWLHGVGRAKWIEVGRLDPAAARELVAALVPRLGPEERDQLVSAFDRHPFGLEVGARALQDDPWLTVAGYLRALQRYQEPDQSPLLNALRYRATQLASAAPAAFRAWQFCGCYTLAPVPVGWLEAALVEDGHSPEAARSGLAELVSRHLAQVTGVTLQLHWQVHLLSRSLTATEDPQLMSRGLLRWLNAAREGDASFSHRATLALPHVEVAAAASVRNWRVQVCLAAVLQNRGKAEDLERAWGLLSRAAKDLAELGPGQTEGQAAILGALGEILRVQGGREQLKASVDYLGQALEADRATGRPAGPARASLLNSLALSLKSLGRLEEARDHLLVALRIYTDVGMDTAPPIAATLNNLALVLRALGGPDRLREAAGHLRRALQIDTEALGLDSPALAITLNNLALVLRDMRQFEGLVEACQHLGRALRICEDAYGRDGLPVAAVLDSLGLTLRTMGEKMDLEEASQHLRRALAIQEASLGAESPRLVGLCNNLAMVLHDIGTRETVEEGIKLVERAEQIAAGSLGEESHKTQVLRCNLVRLKGLAASDAEPSRSGTAEGTGSLPGTYGRPQNLSTTVRRPGIEFELAPSGSRTGRGEG